jgi:hypothetical protein
VQPQWRRCSPFTNSRGSLRPRHLIADGRRDPHFHEEFLEHLDVLYEDQVVQRRRVGDDDHGRALSSLVVGLGWPMALDRFSFDLELVDGVLERYAVSLKHTVERGARGDSEDLAQLVRRELADAIGIDRERLQRRGGRVLP